MSEPTIFLEPTKAPSSAPGPNFSGSPKSLNGTNVTGVSVPNDNVTMSGLKPNDPRGDISKKD